MLKNSIANFARRVAPRTVHNLEALSDLTADHAEGPLRFVAYERELQALRKEVDEMRRDQRRVAEMYDVMFEWAHRDAAARGLAPDTDRAQTDHAVAALDEKLSQKDTLSK